MDEIERYQHQLHARTAGWQRKVARAKRLIDEAFAVMRRPYLAFSGGIDSFCLLDMLYRAGHRIDVQWNDDGADFPATLTFLDESAARYGFRLRRVRSLRAWRLWCEEMGRPVLAGDTAAWLNPPMEYDATWSTWEDRITTNPGYDGVFLGLLAAESRSRGYALHDGRKPLYQVKREANLWHCCPLAHFTKRDVWAWVVSRELPYNPIYDRLAELGMPLERRRVAPLTCYRVLQYGSGVQFRQIDPALWNRMVALFPRLREYS